ncbi:MAG: polysaccharide deacetylase [Lachnospiraceae bacterium]|nr:polysaccharide deacetylase [Lachnospiraceae bacterium]
MGKKFLSKRIIGFISELILFAAAVWIGALLGKSKGLMEENAAESVIETSSSTFSLLKAPARQINQPMEGEKICYLTFDDGPSANTGEILDMLKEYNAKATFFVIGEGLTEENRPILERMKNEGHSIGLHAYNHTYKELYASTESLLADYEKLYSLLKEDYNIETALLRFPGGSACSYLKPHRQVCIEELQRRGFSCFDWQVSGEDAIGYPTVESIQQNVFKKVFDYNTPIVLLHDGRGRGKTVEALPEILKRLQDGGYRFDSLEHRPEYFYRMKE